MPKKHPLEKAMKPSNQSYTKKGATQMSFVIEDNDMFKFKVACILMEKKKISEVLRQIVKEYTERVYKEYEQKHGEVDFSRFL